MKKGRNDGQLSLFAAKQRRDEILTDLGSRSATFNELARAHIMAFLLHHAPATGEAIVDHLKMCGIIPASKDDRGYGPVFMSLSKAKKIVRVGFVPRRKGHAAPGASVWELPK